MEALPAAVPAAEYPRSRSLAQGSLIRGSLFDDGYEDEEILTHHLRAFIFAPDFVPAGALPSWSQGGKPFTAGAGDDADPLAKSSSRYLTSIAGPSSGRRPRSNISSLLQMDPQKPLSASSMALWDRAYSACSLIVTDALLV